MLSAKVLSVMTSVNNMDSWRSTTVNVVPAPYIRKASKTIYIKLLIQSFASDVPWKTHLISLKSIGLPDQFPAG